HARVLSDGIGDALAALEASGDHVPRVPLVHARAAGTYRLAPVAARDVQHPERLGGSVVAGSRLARGEVDSADFAAQPDGVGAATGHGDLAFPRGEVRVEPEFGHAVAVTALRC